MAKSAYIGVSSKAKKIKKIYIGVGGKAKKVKKAYIGVNGKAKLFYNAGGKFFYAVEVGGSGYNVGMYNPEDDSFSDAYTWYRNSLIDNLTYNSLMLWRQSPIFFWGNSWVWMYKRGTSYEPALCIMDKDSISTTQLAISGTNFINSVVQGFVVDNGHAYILLIVGGSKGYFIDVNLSSLTYTTTDTNKTSWYQYMDASSFNNLCLLPNGKFLVFYSSANYLYTYDKSNNTMTQIPTYISGFPMFYNRARGTNKTVINIGQHLSSTDGSSITVTDQLVSTYDHDLIIWCNNEFVCLKNAYMYTSTDGNTWNLIAQGTLPTFGARAFGYGAGIYFAFGAPNTSNPIKFWKSTDKLNWTQLTNSLAASYTNTPTASNATFSDVGINNGVGT